MIRKIIHIDEEKCNGCGLCADACHEGAIGMVDGRAKLLREDYCDGLGDCLPVCPTGAITFEEREAAGYDREAVENNMRKTKRRDPVPSFTGCPGSRARSLSGPEENPAAEAAEKAADTELRQWPVQIQLAPIQAPYFDRAHLLVAADCSAYAYGNFHREFMKGKVTLIGCPKLDSVDYSEKLAQIIKGNEIKSVTVVRMEVPCCGGIEQAVKKALQDSGRFIPWRIITMSVDGNILEE
ncbi:4Fe-4S binding protein [Lachnospiraceae bacterium ASD3451]|uniref:ATP-binding protein n=1 Tax=Diplocloster agilis TaxID=2850323 RepID=UPI001DFA22A8|nr:4Fe-4S binding protein [Diplocloster agilis]MBU9745064.1 4Fe-4S binding protein [Diplocloster agilis]